MSGNIDSPIYPIQLVSRRSGLSVDLIRAWERRYQVVNPRRTQNQRRLYSELDVQHLTLLHRLTALGHRIGDIAALEKPQLEQLLEPVVIGHQSDADSTIMQLRKQALLAVAALDREGLNRLLAEAELQLSLPLLLNEWLTPLMILIGEAWQRGELRAYQEHMASVVIAGWMASKIRQQQRYSGPLLLVATSHPQKYGLSVMMMTLIANSLGWQVHHYLNPLPAEELAAAAKQLNANAIVLTLSYVTDRSQLQAELDHLQQLMPKNCSLLVGGSGTKDFQDQLEALSAIVITDLYQLGAQLQQLARPSLNS